MKVGHSLESAPFLIVALIEAPDVAIGVLTTTSPVEIESICP